ncbi:MAG TPA: ABC transporter ATP-binding protein [Candidatus Bathyarchaeia archaeon]|nr:ABC transporter ATP-binding protein [Candidatus Bathyarchaeia archaeon]
MGSMLGSRVAKRAFEDLRPYLWPIVAILTISLLAVPITLIVPLPIKLLVDSVLGSQPLPGYLTVFTGSQVSKSIALGLAISLLMGTAVVTYLQNLLNVWYSNKIGNRMTLDVRARLFRQMQRLSIAYHDTMGAADSAYRTLNDAPMLRSFGIDSVIPLTTSILTLAAMILVMVYLDWQLALVALLVSPLMFLLTFVFRPRIRAGWRKYRASESAAMAVAQESLGASRLVKSYGQEERKNQQLISHYDASQTAALKVQVDSAVYSLLVGIVTAAGLAAVLYIGIGHVQAGILTLGSLLVVNYYVTQLYTPLRNVGQSILDIQMSLTGVERYRAVLDEKPDVPESPNALPLARAKGKIAFQKVSFEYTKGHPVLQDVSFELPAANCLGVVGPTGSGKTTLSTLLLRLFDPTRGVITLDDVDLKDYKLADLRNQYAVVHQETVLFSTSVAENIRFARPNASMGEIIAAATAAKAHEFITGLPNGYDTLVGDRGMKLSGGERQRISLARAFLKNAPILILDEPTSSLDVHTESAILETIQELMKGRTTMMIAHRASTLRNCNMILVIEEGRVAQMTDEVESIISGMQATTVQS